MEKCSFLGWVAVVVWMATGGGCGSSGSPRTDGGTADAASDRGSDASDASDASDDGGLCTNVTGGLGGCAAGSAYVVQVGGVAGGGGAYCLPIPPGCHGAPTCACMASSCGCTTSVMTPEQCTDIDGGLACDNGIR
jgi:hypothetical protein